MLLRTSRTAAGDGVPGCEQFRAENPVWVRRRTSLVGCRDGSAAPEAFVADGEGPVRMVEVSTFAIEQYAVSNDRFAAFVDATGYRTEAEQFGWSYVFADHVHAAARRHVLDAAVPGATGGAAYEVRTCVTPADRAAP